MNINTGSILQAVVMVKALLTSGFDIEVWFQGVPVMGVRWDGEAYQVQKVGCADDFFTSPIIVARDICYLIRDMGPGHMLKPVMRMTPVEHVQEWEGARK